MYPREAHREAKGLGKRGMQSPGGMHTQHSLPQQHSMEPVPCHRDKSRFMECLRHVPVNSPKHSLRGV